MGNLGSNPYIQTLTVFWQYQFAVIEGLEATSGFEPLIKALQASALPLGHVAIKNDHARTARGRIVLERTTGFEPATPTLARLCSTN